MSHEQRAKEHYANAEKKLNSWFAWGSGRYEEAGEMFSKAGNSYKMAKQYQNSGNSYERAAMSYMKSGNKYEAANMYIQAGQIMQKTDIKLSVAAYGKAVDLFADMGKIAMAAKHLKDVAALLEAEGLVEEAMEKFETAADFYEGENQQSSANQCWLKVAYYAAQLKMYKRAIELYEKVGTASVSNNLLKYSAKDYFFRAGLCYLAMGDVVAAMNAIDRFKNIDMNFNRERECKLLEAICQSFEQGDVTSFTHAVAEYDRISRLDDWKASILLAIKNSIETEDLA